MAVEAEISPDNYSKQPHMVASWDSIGAQLYRWTITTELGYAVSRPRPEQLGLIGVQFESVSGHPATNVHDALLKPSGCHGNVFMTAMQVQLRVISKRVKSDTVSVDNVHKVSHIQHEHYWANNWALWHRADDVNNRWEVAPVCKTRCVLLDRYERNHIKAVPRRPNWRSSRSNSSSWSTVSNAAVRSSTQSDDTCPLSAASSRSLSTLVAAVSVLWYFRYADCVLGINQLL